jgi:hypothetical protein
MGIPVDAGKVRFTPASCSSIDPSRSQQHRMRAILSFVHVFTIYMYFFLVGVVSSTMFVWLISRQPAVLFSQNKPVSSTFVSEQTSTSHQPNEQAACSIGHKVVSSVS